MTNAFVKEIATEIKIIQIKCNLQFTILIFKRICHLSELNTFN